MSFGTPSDRPSFAAGQQGQLNKPQKLAANVSSDRSLLQIADISRHEYAVIHML